LDSLAWQRKAWNKRKIPLTLLLPLHLPKLFLLVSSQQLLVSLSANNSHNGMADDLAPVAIVLKPKSNAPVSTVLKRFASCVLLCVTVPAVVVFVMFSMPLGNASDSYLEGTNFSFFWWYWPMMSLMLIVSPVFIQ
jgi:hypothetical protein